jgi:hypothetical protein
MTHGAATMGTAVGMPLDPRALRMEDGSRPLSVGCGEEHWMKGLNGLCRKDGCLLTAHFAHGGLNKGPQVRLQENRGLQ